MQFGIKSEVSKTLDIYYLRVAEPTTKPHSHENCTDFHFSTFSIYNLC